MDASAKETHSSIEDVADGQDSDAPNDREWTTGIGLYASGSLFSNVVNVECRSSDAGEPAIGKNM